MRLKIKTVDHRTYTLSINEYKTVSELKTQVCKMRGPWFHPETYQLLYAGRVLDDKERLANYSIDERKYLIMLEKPKNANNRIYKSRFKRWETANSSYKLSKKLIMQLGDYTEKQVRQALLINLNNPKRAIKYLKEKHQFFPIMLTPPPSDIFINLKKLKEYEHEIDHFEASKIITDQAVEMAREHEEIRIIHEYNQNNNKKFNKTSDDEKEFESSGMNSPSQKNSRETSQNSSQNTSEEPSQNSVSQRSSSDLSVEESEVSNWKKCNVIEYLEYMEEKRQRTLKNLDELLEMGFPRELSVRAFTTCHGDVQAAANMLLGQEFRN